MGTPRATKRRGRGQHAARLGARLLDQAGGEERAPAAQRPPAVRRGGSGSDAIAEAGQHLDRVAQVLGLEVGVEGIGEQRDLARVPSPRSPTGRG